MLPASEGGKNSATANIEIEGGTIISTAGSDGAGIGSGMGAWDTVSNIKITGGTVTASGSYGGVGIGGCGTADAANITIEGGTVTANGGSGNAYTKSGVGIGGGGAGDCWAVTISGGSVKVNPGTGAIPIGGGNGAVTPTNGTESVYLLEMDGASNSLTIEESCVYAGRRRVANSKVDTVTRCEAPSRWRASTPSGAPHRLS